MRRRGENLYLCISKSNLAGRMINRLFQRVDLTPQTSDFVFMLAFDPAYGGRRELEGGSEFDWLHLDLLYLCLHVPTVIDS